MVSPFTLSAWVSRAVRKITGTRRPSRRSRATTSNPSVSGSITSSTTRSNGRSLASRSAPAPFSAVVTSKPRNRSEAATASRRNGSSSTTSNSPWPGGRLAAASVITVLLALTGHLTTLTPASGERSMRVWCERWRIPRCGGVPGTHTELTRNTSSALRSAAHDWFPARRYHPSQRDQDHERDHFFGSQGRPAGRNHPGRPPTALGGRGGDRPRGGRCGGRRGGRCVQGLGLARAGGGRNRVPYLGRDRDPADAGRAEFAERHAR